MPLYDFNCSGCSAVFRDIFVPRAEDAETLTCPMCGGKLNKLPSRCSFRLKAGGVGGFAKPNSEITGG